MSKITILEGFEHVDFDRVHPWLSGAYWSPGVDREKVERAARHSSLVVSAFGEDEQLGYMRVVSDRTTFAWICDVFVDEQARGQGVARKMVHYALEHPEFRGLKRWLLATKDAHGVYRELDFEPLQNPDRYMVKVLKDGTPVFV